MATAAEPLAEPVSLHEDVPGAKCRSSRSHHARTPSLACEFQQPQHQHKPTLASAAMADAKQRRTSRVSIGSLLAELTPDRFTHLPAAPSATAAGTAPSQHHPSPAAHAATAAAAALQGTRDNPGPTAPAGLMAALDRTLGAIGDMAGQLQAKAAAATGSSKQAAQQEGSDLLAVFPLLPHALRRKAWRLDDFEMIKRLHMGYASQVFQARCVLSGMPVALKVYDLNQLHEINVVQLLREIELHSSIVHCNVVALFAAFQEEQYVVLVQEWCAGGDLHKMLHKKAGRLTEMAAVQEVLQPLLSALIYLHARGITHRDIKPENLLLTDERVLKLADFGLAIDLSKEAAVTRAGTLVYMAPEVLACPLKAKPEDNKGVTRLHYTSSVDTWSVGVLAYELVAGFPPFSTEDEWQAKKQIMHGHVKFPRNLSELACSFLEDAMAKDPADRPTVLEMINHPWMRTNQRPSSADPSKHSSAKASGSPASPKPPLVRARTTHSPLPALATGPGAQGQTHSRHSPLRKSATTSSLLGPR